MAIPTPDSLIDVVKVKFDEPDAFVAKLSAKMADPEIVKYAYRGAGLFLFYVEGYLNNTSIIEIRKQLEAAGYNVIRIDQQVGYVPPIWLYDVKSSGYGDEGVTGTSQTPWLIVGVSKAKVVE